MFRLLIMTSFQGLEMIPPADSLGMCILIHWADLSICSSGMRKSGSSSLGSGDNQDGLYMLAHNVFLLVPRETASSVAKTTKATKGYSLIRDGGGRTSRRWQPSELDFSPFRPRVQSSITVTPEPAFSLSFKEAADWIRFGV